MASSMQYLQPALRWRRRDVAASATATRRLASLLDELRALAQSGRYSLVMSLHQSRSRQAAQMLWRYRDLMSITGADRDAASTK
jgi:hypothetical protein